MKTLATKFSILILILALAAGTQAKAEKNSVNTDKKETVLVNIKAPLLKYISETFKIEGISICICEQEISLTCETEILEVLGLYEDYESNQLEKWMFAELITPMEDTTLEDWMFDTDYFDDNVKIEEWMLDTEYYSGNI